MTTSRIFFVLFLWSPVVQAANLKTDLLFFVPRQIGQSLAAQAKGLYVYQGGTLTTVGDIPVNIENLNVDVAYQLKNLELKDQGLFKATLEFTRIQARIGAIHVDHTVEKLVDGVIVKIKTQIDCDQVVIETRSPIPATSQGLISNQPLSARLDDLRWETTPTQWSVSAAQCAGPTSPSFIETQLNSLWLQSPLLKASVLEQANLKLASWIQERQTWTRNFPEISSQLTARAEEFVDNGNAWVMRFSLNIETEADCAAFQSEPTIESPSVTSPSQDIELQLNFRAINLTARCLHEIGQIDRRDFTRNLPAFQDLLNSTFKKNAVWPDLNRFPTNANFMISSRTTSSFNLYGKNVTPEVAKANPNSLFFNLYANVQSAMSYINGDQVQPYVTFNSVVRSTAVLSAKMSTTKHPTQFTLQLHGPPEARTTYDWDTQTSNPKVGVDIIMPELMKAIARSKLTLNLDPILLSETHQINMSGLEKEGLLLKVRLQLNRR